MRTFHVYVQGVLVATIKAASLTAAEKKADALRYDWNEITEVCE